MRNTGVLEKAQDLGHRFISFCRNNCPALSGRNIFILGAVTLIAAYVLHKLCAPFLFEDTPPFTRSIKNLQYAIDTLENHMTDKGSLTKHTSHENAAALEEALNTMKSVLSQRSVISHLKSKSRTLDKSLKYDLSPFVSHVEKLRSENQDAVEDNDSLFDDIKQYLTNLKEDLNPNSPTEEDVYDAESEKDVYDAESEEYVQNPE
jgi:ElaB/YqjD/DUF883 family membrane-anchored ribosome-binding protein